MWTNHLSLLFFHPVIKLTIVHWGLVGSSLVWCKHTVQFGLKRSRPWWADCFCLHQVKTLTGATLHLSMQMAMQQERTDCVTNHNGTQIIKPHLQIMYKTQIILNNIYLKWRMKTFNMTKIQCTSFSKDSYNAYLGHHWNAVPLFPSSEHRVSITWLRLLTQNTNTDTQSCQKQCSEPNRGKVGEWRKCETGVELNRRGR